MDLASVAEISHALENLEKSEQECSSNNASTFKLLNPFCGLTGWDRIGVKGNEGADEIHEEASKRSDQSVLINFKAVMHNLQKTIAIEHAKKVREGKESVNMNGILRQKYSEDNYYFPDRILNSGLQKKDFTAPFLIDVKLIHQDLGVSVAGKENERKPKMTVVTKVEPQPTVAKEEPKKRKELQAVDPIISSPTLYAMLEQPATKRLKVGESTTFVIPHNQHIPMQQQSKLITNTVPHTVAQSPPAVAVSKNTRSSMPTLSPNPPTLTASNINKFKNADVSKLPAQLAIKPQVVAKAVPDTSHFVSIRPKLPITILTPEKVTTKSTTTSVNSGLFQNSDKDPDDDFSPKIINTQGSVVMVKGTPEKQIQVNGNGRAEINSPRVAKIPQKNGSNGVPFKRSNADGGVTIQGSEFLGCKTCGKTFPSNCDNLFRSHMIIKHGKEVTDPDIFEAKIVVKSWFKCKKCKLMVLNNLEDHHKRCSSEIPYSNAFEAIPVTTDDVPKLPCGLCSESFESRVHLRAHLVEKHPNINNKVLLDPYFRCGVCLLRFKDSTQKLIDHVSKCNVTAPSLETAQEIAQLNLDCEICSKKHSKIRETLFCYQVKTLLRCVLCLHVSKSRANFFNHLKIHHNRRGGGICCPFCNDNVEKPTRQAFDHFIDHHYNVALKRAGEAALVRGRNQLKAQAAACKTPQNNFYSPDIAKLTRPPMQQRRAMPALRPKAFSPQAQLQALSGQRHVVSTAGRFPVSQVLQMNSGSASVVGNHPFPPGTVLSLARLVPASGGVAQQLPIGLTFVPTQNIQTMTTASAVNLEPMDTSAEDSILGM